MPDASKARSELRKALAVTGPNRTERRLFQHLNSPGMLTLPLATLDLYVRQSLDTNADAATRREAQAILDTLFFAVDTWRHVDVYFYNAKGQWHPRTEAILEDFRRHHNMHVTDDDLGTVMQQHTRPGLRPVDISTEGKTQAKTVQLATVKAERIRDLKFVRLRRQPASIEIALYYTLFGADSFIVPVGDYLPENAGLLAGEIQQMLASQYVEWAA